MWNESMIRSFLILARSSSFSEAARISYFTQQAVSKQISRLEKELDTVLVQRFRGGVQLTPAGEVYYEAFRQAIEAIDQAQAEVVRLQSMEELRLGYIEMLMFAPEWGDFVRQFRCDFPNVKIKIETHSDPELLKMLLEDKLDAAIMPGESENLRLNGLKCIALGNKFPTKVCINSNYFKETETIDQERLKNIKIFFPDRGTKWANQRMKEAGLPEGNYEFCSNISAALVAVNMLEGGILVGDHCEFRNNPDLVFLDPPASCSGQTYLAWKADNKKHILSLLLRQHQKFLRQNSKS